jgi:isopentenyl phosphate kinase
LKPVRVFVKLGGSFITDKSVVGSLDGERIRAAALALRRALESSPRPLRLVLGHGAGSYGHILAKEYAATEGVHQERGWEGLHKIRESMAGMNLLFVRFCREGGLGAVTVSPFAVASASGGVLRGLYARSIVSLLEAGQVPVIHGDAVLDSRRGFTIASTEALLEALSREVFFDRVVMVSDTDGVLGPDGATLPRLGRGGLEALAGALGGSGCPDVTGGMRKKVEMLLSLLRRGRAGSARILRCSPDGENLREAVLGIGGGGTLIGGESRDRTGRPGKL